MMKRIDSHRVSIAGIVVGALMVIYSHATSGYPIVVTACIGAALVCTGMVTLTMSEIFKKPWSGVEWRRSEQLACKPEQLAGRSELLACRSEQQYCRSEHRQCRSNHGKKGFRQQESKIRGPTCEKTMGLCLWYNKSACRGKLLCQTRMIFRLGPDFGYLSSLFAFWFLECISSGLFISWIPLNGALS